MTYRMQQVGMGYLSFGHGPFFYFRHYNSIFSMRILSFIALNSKKKGNDIGRRPLTCDGHTYIHGPLLLYSLQGGSVPYRIVPYLLRALCYVTKMYRYEYSMQQKPIQSNPIQSNPRSVLYCIVLYCILCADFNLIRQSVATRLDSLTQLILFSSSSLILRPVCMVVGLGL